MDKTKNKYGIGTINVYRRMGHQIIERPRLCSRGTKSNSPPRHTTSMGSCASKDKPVQTANPPKPHPRSTPAKTTKNGQVLGGGGEGSESTKEAAARAAELRYQNHQDKLKNSQAKLKAMEKISKKEKGLA